MSVKLAPASSMNTALDSESPKRLIRVFILKSSLKGRGASKVPQGFV